MCIVAPALTQIVTHAQRPNPVPSSSIPSPVSSEEEALRVVVERYFAAYGRKDLDGVVALWSEHSPNLAVFKEGLQQQFASEELRFGSPTLSRIKIENERAGLRVTIPQVSINLKSRERRERQSIRSFELAKEAGEWKIRRSVSAADELAEALVKAGNPAERAALLAEDQELMTAELSEALLERGQRLFNQGNRNRAQEIYGQALEVAERGGDKSSIAQALLFVGLAHRSQGSYEQALECYRKSLGISEELGNRDGVASALNNIGFVHRSRGNYQQALESYQKSLEIRVGLDNKVGLGEVLGNIGFVHQAQGHYEQALEFYQKSVKVREELGDRAGIARTLTNISELFRAQDKYEPALEYYQQSLRIVMELGNQAAMQIAFSNIGLLYKLQGDYAQ
ncbi:MAG TPA: tetratricopeptide repeat protein, partial [Blastocatellia bacterium]|nr:tetratricopeptide repeat protein [Blastocatellia bacterium]